jgi:hypothetical protein
MAPQRAGEVSELAPRNRVELRYVARIVRLRFRAPDIAKARVSPGAQSRIILEG